MTKKIQYRSAAVPCVPGCGVSSLRATQPALVCVRLSNELCLRPFCFSISRRRLHERSATACPCTTLPFRAAQGGSRTPDGCASKVVAAVSFDFFVSNFMRAAWGLRPIQSCVRDFRRLRS